jgi:hypothetical protein
MGADSADAGGHILDVIMPTFTGGRERTVDQFNLLLAQAGFHPQTVIETAGPMRIVESIAN